MRIVAEQRYVKKPDGKKYLQCRYIDDTYVDASGAINVAQSQVSDWEDVPLCEDFWDEED